MLDVYERIRFVSRVVQAIYPRITRKEIRYNLRALGRHYDDSRRQLSEEQAVIRSLLQKYDIKPKTAYNWFRVLTLPAYIQQEIREQRMTMNEAFRRNLEQNRPDQIMEDELCNEISGYAKGIAESDFLGGGEYVVR